MLYIASLMGIVAMASAKASVVLLSDRVVPGTPRQRYSILAIIFLWTVFAIFATAFQCVTPQTWVYVPSECSTRGGLVYSTIIGNILSDALVATYILPTLWKLLMNMEKRIKVIFLFGSRLM
jgi:hypothetical protein